MHNKFFKKYKINQLQKIKQNYKYIYIFRYKDLKINEIITLKKKIKNLNYKSLILKQNITNHFFFNNKGQGSLLILYGNDYINLMKELLILKKLELILLISQSNIYSNLKLKEILSDSNLFLNKILINPFFNFLFYLKEYKKAGIA
jgi:ribosomal protein L10